MAAFWAENWGSILVGLLVAGMVAAIAAKLFRDRKKGGCAGCSCGDCPGRTDCGSTSDRQ